ESVLVHELETEIVARVRPVLVLSGGAVGGRGGALDLVGLAERDEDLAPIREPARSPLLLEALVRDGDALEVIAERLVLDGRGIRIGLLPELRPSGGALVRREIAERLQALRCREIPQVIEEVVEADDAQPLSHGDVERRRRGVARSDHRRTEDPASESDARD